MQPVPQAPLPQKLKSSQLPPGAVPPTQPVALNSSPVPGQVPPTAAPEQQPTQAAPLMPGTPEYHAAATSRTYTQDQANAGAAGAQQPGTAPEWLRSSQEDPNNVLMGSQAPWAGGPGVTTTRVNYDGMPDFETDFSQASQNAADEAYAGMTQYMDEDFEADRAAAEARLVNQGFQPGSEAFDRQMRLQQRGQNDTRMQAASQAGLIGHQRAGDLLTRALGTRAAMVGERERDADRIFGQSSTLAEIGLGARGQDSQVRAAEHHASGASAAAGAAAAAARENAQMQRDLALRGFGLQQDSQEFNQWMQLVGASRGGVNMPNFGGTNPLDVSGAYNIASNNRNSQENRDAADRSGIAGLGAAALNYFAR